MTVMPPLLWAEFSIQYLLPAIFLVIWALNQVFGKAEAPQPPIRDRVGPRPMPPPTGPSRAPQTPSRAPRGNLPERSRTSPSQGRVRDSSRVSGRPSVPEEHFESPPPGRVGEPHRVPRPVPKDIQEVYAIYDDDRMDPAEIQRGLGPISADVTHSSHTQGLDLPVGLSAWTNLAETGIAPSRLREAIILSEILSPPASVRRLQEARSLAMASVAAREAAESASGAEPEQPVKDEARES